MDCGPAGPGEEPEMAVLKGKSLVACGTLRREIRALSDKGAIEPDRIFFTPPGLHEWPAKLEEMLQPQLGKAREASPEVIVLYGEKCFIDIGDPVRDLDALLGERGPEFRRVRAKNCVDMLVAREERESIAGEEKIYWLTPGWVENWKYIFRFWDEGKANEMFPAYGKAVVLDPLGYYDEILEKDPEKILGISDWMKIPLEAHPVGLDRLVQLLSDVEE